MAFTWFIAIVAVAFTAIDATVRTIDGNTTAGEISELEQSGLILLQHDGPPRRIERAKLSEVLFENRGTAQSHPAVDLLLTDGSLVPAADCELSGGKARIKGPVGVGNEESLLTLPTAVLRAVRFDRTTANQDEAWQQLTEGAKTSDLLVVYKKSRGTLDYVEGVIQNVTPSAVEIEVDEERMEVPRERVFGIVFFRRDDGQQGKTPVRVQGAHGMSLLASDVRLDAEELHVNLHCGEKISISVGFVASIGYSTDAVTYLSDLVPLENTLSWRPFFDPPVKSPLFSSWGKPRLNESFGGDKLKLEIRDEGNQPMIREFDRGLAMRSRSEAAFRLPSKYNSFQAMVGIDPESHLDSEALLIVEADGQSIGEWRLVRNNNTQEINVNVSGKKQLRLIVDYGSGTDSGAVVHICDPRLLK